MGSAILADPTELNRRLTRLEEQLDCAPLSKRIAELERQLESERSKNGASGTPVPVKDDRQIAKVIFDIAEDQFTTLADIDDSRRRAICFMDRLLVFYKTLVGLGKFSTDEYVKLRLSTLDNLVKENIKNVGSFLN